MFVVQTSKKMIKSVSNESSIGRGAQRLSNGHIFLVFVLIFSPAFEMNKIPKKNKKRTEIINSFVIVIIATESITSLAIHSYTHTYAVIVVVVAIVEIYIRQTVVGRLLFKKLKVPIQYNSFIVNILNFAKTQRCKTPSLDSTIGVPLPTPPPPAVS